MSKNDKRWIVQLNDQYLKHPSGPQLTKDPAEAYGCHYKDNALTYLEEFAYLTEPPYNKTSKVELAVLRRGVAKKL